MSKFLVLRRMDLGTIYGAGSIVEDPPDVQLLIDRHYITPVPDDYKTPEPEPEDDEPQTSENTQSGQEESGASTGQDTPPATDPATPAAGDEAKGEGAGQSPSGDEPKPNLPAIIDLSGVEATPATPPTPEVTGA